MAYTPAFQSGGLNIRVGSNPTMKNNSYENRLKYNFQFFEEVGMEKDEEKVNLRQQGDHHQVNVSIDPNTGKISGGIVNNFSDNSAAALSIDEQGKAQGTFIHSGDTHAFQINAKSDGSFEGAYIDKKKNLELNVSSDVVSLEKGKIPEAGLSINGNHHKASLQIDENGKISGTLESKATDNQEYALKVENGKIIGGSFTHIGNNHKTEVSLSKDGWQAQVSGGKGSSSWSIGVEKGKAETKVLGGMKIKF